MLDNEERQRFDELAFAITKRPLSAEESAEYGGLMALDLGASRDPFQPPEQGPRGHAGNDAGKPKHKRRRRRR